MSGTTSDVGRLLVRIEATTAQLRGQLNAAQGDIDKFTKSTQQKLSGFERAFQSVGQNALKSITGIAAGVIAVSTVTRALTDMVRVADQAAQASSRIGSAIGDMRAGREVFDTIARSAQRTGTSANDAVDAFLRFSIATRQIGGTREQTLQLVDTMQKLAVVSGTSGQAGGAAMMQLGQALASGRLQGDELRSILENMPTLAEGLARQLNVSVGALRQMGTEGKLTSETVFAAILRMAPEINRQFGEMPISVQRATVSLSQAWDNLTTQLDRALDITGRIARSTQAAADTVQRLADRWVPEGTEDALRRVREEIEAITKAERERAEASLRAPANRNSIRSGLTGTAQGVYSDEANQQQLAALREQEAELARVADAERELSAHLAANESLTAALQAAENRRQQTLRQVQAAQEALGGTNTKTQEQMAALRLVVDAGAEAMARYGISAQTASGMLAALGARADSVRQTIASLDAQTAQAGGGIAARIDAALRQAAPGGNTDLLQPEQIEAVTAAVRRQGEAAAEAAVQQATAETAVARARATGGEAAGRRAQVERQVAEAVRNGATEAQAATLRTQLLAQANYAAAGASAGRLQPMAQVLRGLQEEARSAEAAATAATQGAAAQRVASQADKARAEALKVARDGTEAYTRAYSTFLALVQRGSRGEAQADIAERTRGLQADIALIERETQLIGGLPGHREAEMAALRVRNELLASGRDYTEEEISGVEALVRARETAAQAQREIEDRLRQIRQTSEEISRDVATVLFESMTNDGKGESVVDWFKALFRRIAIQALQANIILPITQQIIGAAPGLFGIGGSATSTSGSGIGSLLGGVGASSGSGTLLGGLGGVVSNPIWQSGAGWFQSAGAGTNAALSGLGAGVYGPAVPASGVASSLGGTSLGGYAAGIGAGYMTGSTIGGYVAGNSPARQQNAQIGAAGGAVAGAIIGSVVPVIGTALGAVIGGAIGGAGGGLIGPGKGFSGGDVGIGASDNGQLRIRSSGGKNWDSGAANQQVQQQIDQINTLLRATGVMITGFGDNTASTIGFGDSGKVGGPTEIFQATKAYMQTSNETLAKVMKQAWFQSFEDLQVIAPYANDNATLRGLMDTGHIRSRDDFNKASEFITQLYEPLSVATKQSSQLAEGLRAIGAQFDPVIQQAREYGLATWELEENRRKAINETLKPLLEVGTQTNAYTVAMTALRDEYKAAIAAAAELGRATDDLGAAFGRAQKALIASSRQQFDTAMREALDRGFITQFIGVRDNYNATADEARSIGRNPDNLLIAQMRQLARQLNDAQLDQVIRALSGIDDVAAAIALEQKAALAAERAKTEEAEKQLEYAEQLTRQMNAGLNIRQWVNGQRASAGSGLSPQMALTAAQSAFGEDLALARSGDLAALDRITSTADTLLRAGTAMYGTGPQGSALREMVLNSLESLPAVQSYDDQILAALKALGGGVNVSVAIETVRIIQEQLNLLPQGEKDQLVQAQDVVRTVQEKLGRVLTEAERDALIKAAEVERDIQQKMSRNLTAAERASLVASSNVIRAIEQKIGRDLSAVERGSLIYAADVVRDIEQKIKRQLTPEELQSILQSGQISREIQQLLQRDLTEAERRALVISGKVSRAVEQKIGRPLTATEFASLVTPATIARDVQQAIGRNLTEAERASLVQSAGVTRNIQQIIGRALTAAEKAGLVSAGSVIRAIEEKIGRKLTAAEKALIIQPGTVPRNVTQTVVKPTGSAVIPGGTITRNVKQNVATVETIQLSRSIDQNIRAALDTLNYTVKQHLPYLLRLRDMQDSLYLIREMARGQWGGVRVTTQKASGAANGPGFDRWGYDNATKTWVRIPQPAIGNSNASLTVNALGNAFGGGQVIPFAKGGLPEMTNVPTYAPLALFGEAGPEAILPLQRGRGGKLGVAATGGGNEALTEEFRQYRKQSAMETMALRDELRGVRSELDDIGAALRRANAA